MNFPLMYPPLFSNQSVMHDMSWPQQKLAAAVAEAITLPSYLVPRLESISVCVLFSQECTLNRMTDDAVS